MSRPPLTLNASKAISEPAVFITGTDTGAGKTVVSAVLAVAAAARGSEAGYLKPVQTGVLGDADRAGGAHPLEGLESLYARRGDAAFVEAVASSRGFHVRTRTTFSFPLPASPLVAASDAGARIEISEIEKDFEELQGLCDFVVVEGAGGLLVPIARDFTMADLAARLGLACVVACKPSLGTLNHTLLTVEAAHRRGLLVLGLAMTRMPSEPTVVELTNVELVAELTGLEVILVIPEYSSLDVEAASPGGLADLAVQVPRGFSSPKQI